MREACIVLLTISFGLLRRGRRKSRSLNWNRSVVILATCTHRKHSKATYQASGGLVFLGSAAETPCPDSMRSIGRRSCRIIPQWVRLPCRIECLVNTWWCIAHCPPPHLHT